MSDVCAQTRYIYGTRCEPLPPALPTLAELESEIVALRRRIVALEHRCNDRQAAHNGLLDEVERLGHLLERRP